MDGDTIRGVIVESKAGREAILAKRVIDATGDRPWATVGSSNLDPLSLLLAREANVVVEDAHFAAELRGRLLQVMAHDARCLQAVLSRHLVVQQHKVEGAGLLDAGQGFAKGRGQADRVEPFAYQKGRDRFADQVVIICQKDFHGSAK